MKGAFAIAIALSLTGCATQHRPPVRDIGNVYIDCTNKAALEKYFNIQLSLTDMSKVNTDPDERAYYSAIKEKIWQLRSSCR